ncbi:hypothetical protein, conserved [Plasmodium gonderi]|uniref:ER membrane protein complex subunit 1 n=1 Tax=Plasmodium gonderi TaxID=77519 RepID=A0A1Y1JLP5_PLAGO|nr:hypothetical protein, conserved [Plasmodium gonderi]GAW83486.1 hypothetical protein, conserved [Plasmodium gonderi]
MLFNFFICFVALLTKLTFEKHTPYSNVAPLIGHVNYIIPTLNFINNFVIISSFNGNVGLLNYKTGTLDYVKNHGENEKIKKLYGDDNHAAVLIYKGSLEENDVIGNHKNNEDFYCYVNVYNTVYSHLLSSFEYRNEIINDFFIKDDKIFMHLNNKIDIGNITNNRLFSLNFKELNVNCIYSKIIGENNLKITLFYVDAEFWGHIVNVNILKKSIENSIKITEFKLNDKIVNYINIVKNKTVLVIYNKEFLHWIELLNEENKYHYGFVPIGESSGEVKVDKKEPQDEKRHIETRENNERITEPISSHAMGKCKLFRDDGMEQWNTENYFIVRLQETQFVYMYNDNKMNLIKEKDKNEIIGYYMNQYNEKDMIFAEDKGNKIFIKKAGSEGEPPLNVLHKSDNVYYKGEMIIGIYNKEENSNYYFSVYNDASLTVYKNNDVCYSREESLAYIEQLNFYNFQHLKKKKKKTNHSYNTKQFDLMNELDSYIKDKIHSFNKPFLEDVVKKKAENSLLPFNFFYLSYEDKMNLLNICMEKKKKNDSLINYGMEGKVSYSKDSQGNTNSKKGNEHKSNLMNNMIKDAFTKYEQSQSGKYAGSSLALVSTSNNLIFAIHLYTGLILYKIDGNKFKVSKEIFSPKIYYESPFSLNKDNWSELDNGKKLIFLNNQKGHDATEGKKNEITNEGSSKDVLNYSNDVHLFKSFTKDTAIAIFKNDKISHIVIFDILSGDIIFEKKIESFEIKNFFIDRKNSSILAMDNFLNVKIIPLMKGKGADVEIADGVDAIPGLENDLFFYRMNESNSLIEGFKLISSSPRKKEEKEGVELIRIYSINLNNEKLEVFSKSITKKDMFYPIKINKDASICYKYVSDNIISYITSTNQKKNIIYTLYIIDGITGDLIFSKMLDKHTNPPFHLMISENHVILNYFNVNLKKYIIQIIEILLDKRDPGFFNLITSKKEKIVDLFDQKKKIIVKEKNYIIEHNIKSFNFTETKRGITNKQILLLLESNKITSLNLGTEKDQNVYKNLNTFITQTDILYNSKGFISNESLLESTTLVFSWGNYLYFTCYQPNGSFDTIENFNLLVLLFLIILVFIGTYISYLKRINKTLHSKWA